MNCFVDFASQCGETGVNVEVTDLSMESDFYGFTEYGFEDCFDWIQFAFTVDENQMLTDNLCGCMDDPNHPSCDSGNISYVSHEYLLLPSSTDDLNETLVGTDIKFIIRTNGYNHGGQISV